MHQQGHLHKSIPFVLYGPMVWMKNLVDPDQPADLDIHWHRIPKVVLEIWIKYAHGEAILSTMESKAMDTVIHMQEAAYLTISERNVAT